MIYQGLINELLNIFTDIFSNFFQREVVGVGAEGILNGHVLIQSGHRRALTPAVSGCVFGDASPPEMHPAPALAATRRTATARGGAERNPGSPHHTTPRPNGANGDQTNPVPCALSGHGRRCMAWSPGFHPGLSPVAPSGQESGDWELPLGRRVRAPGLQRAFLVGRFQMPDGGAVRRVGVPGLQEGIPLAG